MLEALNISGHYGHFIAHNFTTSWSRDGLLEFAAGEIL